MKLLPRTRGETIRLAAVLIILAGLVGYFRLDQVSWYYLSDKREGDILFQSLPNRLLKNPRGARC